MRSRANGRRPERRAHARVDLQVPALVDSVRAWERCWCSNLSEGGLALRSTTPFKVGDAVDIYFELPGGGAVETSSRVVDVSGDCVRVKFDHLSGEQRLSVFRYVVSKRPPSPPRRTGSS